MYDDVAITSLRDETAALQGDTLQCLGRLYEAVGEDSHTLPWGDPPADFYWRHVPTPLCNDAEALVRRIVALVGRIAAAARNATLTTTVDERELGRIAKSLRAALRLRHYRLWEPHLLHDEGTVLGLQPGGQSECDPLPPSKAIVIATEDFSQLMGIIDLVLAGAASENRGSDSIAPVYSRIKSDTAFIMMWMNRDNPDLEDVHETVRQTFAQFNIKAIRADDIEHEGIISERVLNEIQSAEFLFADLSGARPNVYYEVGYAHALNKRVILFRKAGTGIHFDLSGYNCPEYRNLTHLREQLVKRLEALTNRERRHTVSGS